MDPQALAAALVARTGWLALATTDDAGHAASSYVPFVAVDGAFAIAVSGLAAHTRHLQARPEASVLLVGPGTDDGDAFARPRLMVAVRARYVERGSATSGDLWAALARRHGETVETLRGLPDFATLRLEPTSGRAIFGFAAASDLDAATLRDVLRTAS